MAKSKKVETIEDATEIYASGSICLSDIPKNLIFVSPKNGKKYLRVVFSKRSEIFYGNTHSLSYSPTAQEREGGITPINIGNFVEWKRISEQPSEVSKPKKASPAPETKSQVADGDTDSLPF